MSKQDDYVRHTVRIPSDVYAKVEASAAENNRSINGEIIARLEGSTETLRDKFAGNVASGMAAFSGTAGVSYGPDDIAGRAYQVADAMLAARSEPSR